VHNHRHPAQLQHLIQPKGRRPDAAHPPPAQNPSRPHEPNPGHLKPRLRLHSAQGGSDGGGGLWSEIAYVVHIDDFARWLEEDLPVILSDPAAYTAKREAIAAAREQYFTFDAVMRHLRRFIERPRESALQCVFRRDAA
jgi:hypothetical protein